MNLRGQSEKRLPSVFKIYDSINQARAFNGRKLGRERKEVRDENSGAGISVYRKEVIAGSRTKRRAR